MVLELLNIVLSLLLVSSAFIIHARYFMKLGRNCVDISKAVTLPLRTSCINIPAAETNVHSIQLVIFVGFKTSCILWVILSTKWLNFSL